MTSQDKIAAVIPVHPACLANGMLSRALASAQAQLHLPKVIVVELDLTQAGSRETRRDAVLRLEASSDADWVAFLDSDDEWYPQHLRDLLEASSDVDYVYSWYDVGSGGTDPRPHAFGVPYAPDNLQHHPTGSAFIRADLAIEAMSAILPKNEYIRGEDPRWSDDYALFKECVDLGARVRHLPEKTWLWHHHASNTSGLPPAD